MLNIVVLIAKIMSAIDVVLITKVVSTIVILIARIVSIKDTLITFKNIVIVLTVRFVLAEVLFVVFINIIEKN